MPKFDMNEFVCNSWVNYTPPTEIKILKVCNNIENILKKLLTNKNK